MERNIHFFMQGTFRKKSFLEWSCQGKCDTIQNKKLQFQTLKGERSQLRVTLLWDQ